MPSKSGAKGKRYERHVAKLLTEATNVNFRKVFGSGMINKTGGVQVAPECFAGDVTCDRRDFLFCVEAKNRKRLTLSAVLFEENNKCEFTTAWAQCVGDAESMDRLPVFFFKPNANDDWVCFTAEGIELLEISGDVPRMVLDIYHKEAVVKLGSSQIKTTKLLPTPILFRWRTLVTHCNPAKMFGDPDGLRMRQE